MNQLISTTTIPQTVILQYPPEDILDKKWVIALISALCGVMIAFFLDVIRSCIKTKRHRKIVAKSIFTEIAAIRRLNNNDLPKFKKVIEEFKSAVQKNDTTIHPAIEYTEKHSIDFYKSYLKDLGLFNQYLAMKIFIFYEYYKSIHANTKMLANRFKRYYEGDKMIGYQDVIKTAKDKIKQMEILDRLGAQIIADLIYKYKVDSEKEDKELKKKKENLVMYLKEINKDAIVDIKQVAEQFEVDMILCVIVILELKKFKDIASGQYKKIN